MVGIFPYERIGLVLTRCCMFVRGNQLPPWVNDTLTATELDKALKNHITKVMEHYRGKLYAIDVIVSTCVMLLDAFETKIGRV